MFLDIFNLFLCRRIKKTSKSKLLTADGGSTPTALHSFFSNKSGNGMKVWERTTIGEKLQP